MCEINKIPKHGFTFNYLYLLLLKKKKKYFTRCLQCFLLFLVLHKLKLQGTMRKYIWLLFQKVFKASCFQNLQDFVCYSRKLSTRGPEFDTLKISIFQTTFQTVEHYQHQVHYVLQARTTAKPRKYSQLTSHHTSDLSIGAPTSNRTEWQVELRSGNKLLVDMTPRYGKVNINQVEVLCSLPVFVFCIVH